MNAATNWQERPEAGNTVALRFMLWIAQHCHRRIFHAMLYPIAAYFYCVRRPERAASKQYLSRVLNRPAKRREIFRHFVQFAKVTADRFYFLSDTEHQVPVTFVGEAALERVLQQQRPGIFLAAHFGSFEAARVVGPERTKMINGRFVELLQALNPQMVDNIIDSEQGSVALGLSIADALKTGAWIGFLADRHRPGDRTVSHGFLGTPANFPIGPYIIASTFKAPIICAFCHVTDQGYEVHCEVLSESVNIERKYRQQQLQELSAKYVERLEHHARIAPYGWFNFYDFWATASDK